MLDAQYEIGLMFANGVGVEQDFEQALHWIRQAADRGLAAAQYLLGTRYTSGVVVEQDDHKALMWFLKAAEQAHPKAMFRLGKFYANIHPNASHVCISKAAEMGLAEAQFAVGLAYAAGKDVGRDQSLAVHWYRCAAEQGLAPAQHALATMYADGLGVAQDIDTAMVWYRKAAGQRFAAAQVAMEFIDASGHGRTKGRSGSRLKQGFAERRGNSADWEKAAEFGDADAKYHLGMMYELALGVSQDMSQAEKWYQMSAKQGDARAQLALAKILEERQDPVALAWYRDAAEQGDLDAQFALGRIYSSTQNAVQDHLLGTSWYLRAAEGGDLGALLTLGHLFSAGVDHLASASYLRAAQQGVAEAQYLMGQQCAAEKGNGPNIQQAVEWWGKAAEQGHVQAQSALGCALIAGQGVAKDFQLAKSWFQKAADQGDAKAQWNLGSLYASGCPGLKRDLLKAFSWCQSSADLGFLPAQATLGFLFARLKNMEMAATWWFKAAERGDPEAQYNLALLYSKGQGVKQDLELAFHWFAEAAGQGVVSAQSRLGLLYAKGEGVAHDPIEAHKWFDLASRAADVAAKTNCARSESKLTQAQLAEAQRRADRWVLVNPGVNQKLSAY
jgi:TPR repeat protein